MFSSTSLSSGVARDSAVGVDAQFAQLQNSMLAKLLTVRISLQQVIDESNRFPVLECDKSTSDNHNNSSMIDICAEEQNDFRDGLYPLLDDMLGLLRQQIQGQTTMTSTSLMDDSEYNKIGKKRRRAASSSVSARLEWEDVVAPQVALQPQWEKVVNLWHARSHFGSEHKKSKLKVFNQTIWDQIDEILADESRVLEKSRVPAAESERKKMKIIDGGQSDENFGISSSSSTRIIQEGDYDLEVYDDRQFYSQLLKSFITASSSSSSGGSAGDVLPESMRAEDFAALKRFRKSKSKVDRKASKGRKIRYVPHEKLKNYMFPIPYLESSIDADNLFKSLFQ